MIKVGFTGVPGAGKTSTARALVAKLRTIESLKRAELVQEYARRYIGKHGPMEALWEQYRITGKQIEWEDSIPTDKLDIMITDSPIFLGFIYAVDFEKKNHKDIMVYNDIFKLLTRLNFPEPRYDIIFHLPPKLNPVDDGVRAAHHLEPKWRKEMDEMILASLKIFPPKVLIELGSLTLEERLDECTGILKEYLEKT